MALAPLESFLRRHRRLALDTSVFIYEIQSHSKYAPATDQVFAWLERPDHTAVAATTAMTEFMVQPYRDSTKEQAAEFYVMLLTYPNLEWIPLSVAIADAAAKIRARFQLSAADAIHAATAIRAGATGLITNDSAFTRVGEFETFLLDHAVK